MFAGSVAQIQAEALTGPCRRPDQEHTGKIRYHARVMMHSVGLVLAADLEISCVDNSFNTLARSGLRPQNQFFSMFPNCILKALSENI